MNHVGWFEEYEIWNLTKGEWEKKFVFCKDEPKKKETESVNHTVPSSNGISISGFTYTMENKILPVRNWTKRRAYTNTDDEV